jgi:TRAP-type mannitol/chloroaromatic compound transport system permease small subunit
MDKCLECGELCREPAILVQFAQENLVFCSFECLVVHSIARLCRRIARQNRRVRRFVKRSTACEAVHPGRTAKRPVR